VDASLKTPRPYRLKLFLGMLIVLVMINLILSYSFNLAFKMTSRHAPFMNAVMMIKQESTLAHLWFEELISGDKDEDITTIDKHIQNAIWYSNAMLQGGTNEEGVILPLKNAGLRVKIEKILKDLHSFQWLTQRRYEDYNNFGMDKKLDQEYDAFFKYFMRKTSAVKKELKVTIDSEFRTYTLIYYLLLTSSIFLTVTATFFLYRYEKQKNDSLDLLTCSHDTLERYKERMELAFTGSNDGLWDWDLVENRVYLSPRWKSMLGYEEDELVDSFDTWHERIHLDDLDRSDRIFQEHLSGKTRIYENTHRLRHKDGSWVWVLAHGKAQFNKRNEPVRFIGTHTDVTQEKHLEEDLRLLNNTLEEKVVEQVAALSKSTQMFESIFEVTKNGIALVDLNSNFLLVNEAYEKMTGFSADELYTKSCLSLSEPAELDEYTRALERTLEKGYYGGFERLCLRKNGSYVETKVDITVMPDKQGFLIVTKDMTEENRYKKQRQEHEEYLLQQSRMAQMGEMISMIAHQWRQPLSAISASSMSLQIDIQLEKFDLKEDEQRQRFQTTILKGLERISEYVQSLTTTINDFRNFYKPNKETTLARISDPVIKALSIIQASLVSDKIEVEVRYESHKMISMYENEMMQVILNILKNAQDHFMEKSIQNPKITIVTKDSNQGTILEICDNAGGIPDDVIKKIFNPYFSTKSEKNGTGLGLYMSKIIVEAHHKGDFFVENRDDGACFIIEVHDKQG